VTRRPGSGGNRRRSPIVGTDVRRLLLLAIGTLALLLAGAACGDGSTGDGPSGAPTAGDLDGRTFVTEGLTVSFLDGRLSAQPGCNTVGGPFAVEDGRLVVTELATTSMACEDPALMDRDTAFAAFVEAGPTIALDGPTLTLATADTTWVLTDREVADPDRPLPGQWSLETLVEGEIASSVPAGVTADLVIPPSVGTSAVWRVGCETTAAEVVIDEAARTMTFTEARRDVIGDCQPSATPDEDARVHEAMDAVLTGTVSYEVDADVLTVTTSVLGLQFRAAA
jgi:heat shock protein HslJ